MSTITTRAGKGSPLTNNEVDANFTNLNTDKAELSGATFTGDVASTGFSGDITGAILFQAKAGEALTKGDPVYISGISGNQTVVSKADANDANKMPCFGIVDATVSINANCSVVTFGTLSSLDTSAFGEGDELYISDTGTLSTTAPTGEASQLQKIAKVTRSHASSGSIKVMGAGRTNATPNLDDGKFFLGNSSNQSASATFSTSVTGIALPLSGGAMTGAITTNSTFDGRDVATDGSKLDGIEAGADVTNTNTVTAAGALMDSELTSIASVKALNQGVATTDSPTFVGLTASGEITANGGIALGDNDIATFGASDDLQIYHDGSASRIVDSGTGGLTLQADANVVIQNSAGTETKAEFTTDGGVNLYYDNAAKLATTSTGIEVTGNALVGRSSNLSGQSGSVSANTVVSAHGPLSSHATNAGILEYYNDETILRSYGANAGSGELVFKTGGGGGSTDSEAMRISSNGDISFYEDTGTTPKLFWDASAESLGIGTSSPSAPLTVLSAQDYQITAAYNAANSTSYGYYGIKNNNTGNPFYFHVGGSERFRIAADGSLSTPTAGTSNVRFGVNAGNSIVSGGNYNTVVGDEAGTAITTGDYNVALGYNAGQAVTTGQFNTLIGSVAGDALTSGSENVAVGVSALTTDTLGKKAVAVGNGALGVQNFTSATDSYNVGVGYLAGAAVTTGTQNTIIGGLAADSLTTGIHNVALGYAALTTDTKGSASVAIGNEALSTQNFTSATNTYNTAVGDQAGKAVTTGVQNTLIGGLAGDAITTGSYNAALGYASLTSNTTGERNTALGNEALKFNTTGLRNVAVGLDCLLSNTSGSYNSALGYGSLANNTTASNNTAVGYFALVANTTGTANAAMGGTTLTTNTTGSYNSGFGRDSLGLNTTGSNNTAVGESALYANTTASNNTAVGRLALVANTTGAFNTALGRNAGASNTTASRSTFVGQSAGTSNTTGSFNVALGDNALLSNTTGTYNTALGTSAGLYTTGSRNTFIGGLCGDANTSASNNTAVGYASFTNNTTGTFNTAMGYNSLGANTTASYNTAIGHNALNSNTTGTENVAIGPSALRGVTTGYENIGIGRNTGEGITTGIRNTFIGDDAGYLITGGSGNTIIGRYTGNNGGLDIRNSSNNIVLSDGAGNPRGIFNSSGTLLINTTSILQGTQAKLQVLQNVTSHWTSRFNSSAGDPYGLAISYTGASPNGTSNYWIYCADTSAARFGVRSNGGIENYQANNVNLSDEREKNQFGPLDSTTDCVRSWEVVKFLYKDEDQTNGHKYGVIAQQVAPHCPEVISNWTKVQGADEVLWAEEDDDIPEGVSIGDVKTEAVEQVDRIGVKEQQMFWMLVKSHQEALDTIESLTARIAALEE
jgi:hypothetical protein